MNSLKNKNIIFVLGSLELGGSERQALYLAKYLAAEENCNVRFFGFSNPGEAAKLCDQYGIPWKIVKNPIKKNIWKQKFALIKFAIELRREKPDIILPYTTVPNVACGLVWRWTGAKLCVWNQRDLGIERIKWNLEYKAVNNMPVFFSNSKGGADFLTNTFKIDQDKIITIHNGIEIPSSIDSKKAYRKCLEVNDQDFLVCMVANLSRNKDHITLLKAWRSVMDYFINKDIKPILLLAGRFDKMASYLQDLSIDLHLSDQIKFLGQVNDISSLLNSVDLGVFSSFSEGNPNSVLESMMAGLSIVATDIPGVREAVGDQGSIQLVPAGDPEKMAEKIIEFVINPSLRVKIGEKNRKRVKAEFNLNRMYRDTVSVLNRMLNE